MIATGIKLEKQNVSTRLAVRQTDSSHIASDTMTNTYLGTIAKYVPMAMKLEPKVYIVGAHALGMDSARSTVRNFPKPPNGERMASMSPPTLLPSSNPACHAGTRTAHAANSAPRKCTVSCGQDKRWLRWKKTATMSVH